MIEVDNENGINRMVIIKENINKNRGMEIENRKGDRWLFWNEWGEKNRIERVGMDGKKRSVIISKKI
jgi:hypothetical protein